MKISVSILIAFFAISTAFAQFAGQKLGVEINSTSDELSPRFSADGKTLFFVRAFHENNLEGKEAGQDVWMSKQDVNGNWSKAANIGSPVNNETYNGIGGVGSNGELILTNFYNAEGDYIPGISVSKLQNGSYTKPAVFYPSSWLGQKGFLNFYVTPDLQILIISTMLDEANQEDLFISFMENGSWTKPLSLGTNINTNGFETSPFLSKDTKKLFFASNGLGGQGDADIFMSERLDSSWTNWSTPVPLEETNTEGFDGYFILDPTEENAYFVSGESATAMGDIYTIKVTDIKALTPEKPVVNITKTVRVTGMVIDNKSGLPIAADIVFTDLETNERIDSISSNADGAYEINLPVGKTYSMTAEKENYFSISETLDLMDVEDDSKIIQSMKVAPVEVGQTIKMNNIFFELNKAELNAKSFPELDRLGKLMKDNPKMKIEIDGHTDNQGSHEYNQKLSQNRVQSVMDYLKNHEIEKSRLVGKGWGEEKPVSTNDTEEGRAQNRRVEFTILEN